MQSIKVQQPFFDFIKNGKKIIEGRLNKGKFEYINTGDVIKICCNDDEHIFITAYIKDVRKYISFYQYLFYEGLEKTLPNISNINDACNVYHKFYTHDQEKKYGVIAIELQVIV